MTTTRFKRAPAPTVDVQRIWAAHRGVKPDANAQMADGLAAAEKLQKSEAKYREMVAAEEHKRSGGK